MMPTPPKIERLGPALWAAAMALGLFSLAVYHPYPYVDDYLYAPLAELRWNRELFPNDDQFRGYINHAWVYSLAYLAAKHSLGVAPGFWLLASLLALFGGLGLYAFLRRFGANGLATAFSLILLLLLEPAGMGRGTYGGFIAGFFHHQGVALCLILWSFTALLGSRAALAGLLLGLAAYAQPMTALHGAFAVGMASLMLGRGGLVPLLRAAGVSLLAALPLAFLFLGQLPGAESGEGNAGDVIQSYLFRAPHHYSLPGEQILTAWIWIAAALLALAALPAGARRRQALGLLLAFALLLLASTLGHHLWQSELLLLYILDITRSSPLAFALAAVLLGAALERALSGGWPETRAAKLGLALALALAALQIARLGTPLAWLMAAISLLLMLPRAQAPALRAVIAGLAIALFVVTAPQRARERETTPAMAGLATWAQEETRADALFIIPPSLQGFRHYAKRSAYVDFKAFPVAQPDQARLIRQRLEQVVQPSEEVRQARGWEGIALWDWAYTRHADCAGMARVLEDTGADYFLRPRKLGGEIVTPPDCAPALRTSFANDGFTVYRAARGLAATPRAAD